MSGAPAAPPAAPPASNSASVVSARSVNPLRPVAIGSLPSAAIVTSTPALLNKSMGATASNSSNPSGKITTTVGMVPAIEPRMTPLAPANFHGQRLVIFGAGYVGGALARQAVAVGLRVTALTRNPDRAAELTAAGIDAVTADLASTDWHDRIPADAELVLNCVASGGGGLPGYRHGYVDGFRSILAWAARAATPGHLIYTGSTSVYPQGDGARIDEPAPSIPPSDHEPAGLLATPDTPAQRWPGRRTVLRLAGIYGPGRHHLLDQLRATPPPTTLPGAGEHHLNLIHRDDICGGCWAAWSAGDAATGIFNLADDGATTRAELV